MAYDKVIDSAALEANLKTVADAIRAKAGTSDALAFPAGFAEAIAAISASGDGFTYGTHTPASSTNTVQITHGLGSKPKMFMVYQTPSFSIKDNTIIVFLYAEKPIYFGITSSAATNFGVIYKSGKYTINVILSESNVTLEVDNSTIELTYTGYPFSTNSYSWIAIA